MAESYNTNLVNVAASYIKALKVPLTFTSLKQNLQENPYYPSLYSLSNTFERFNIEHEAFEIEDGNIEQFTPPFIAYLKNLPTGKDFVLVTTATKTHVSYISENKKVKTVTKESFLKDWEHIVLKAQPGKESGEKDFLLNRKKEITKSNKVLVLISIGTLLLFATLYLFIHSLNRLFMLSAAFALILKIAGLATSVLLLIYQIDKSNAFVKSICTIGKQTNCDAVLQSKASKIMGMSWSEAGFFYFFSTFLFILFPSVSFENKIVVLGVSSSLAVPYILFSVYYQWKIVKQWCLLCLTVQAILFLEFAWSVINFWQHPYLIDAPLIIVGLSIICCLLLPIVLLYAIMPLLLIVKAESVYQASYKRLLYNPETFNNLLQQQVSAPDGYQNIGITIGNPDAKNTIIKVCNPYCGPCAKAHATIDEILQNNKNIKLKLIFTASNDVNDIRGIAAKHLLAIYAKQNVKQTEQALHDWYLADKKDYKAFTVKYPMNGELKLQERQIDEMSLWCKEANITATPTLFVNGHRLPENYSIQELLHIL